MSGDKLEIAWAAGLFEGEGCFSLHHNGRTARAILGMTDEDVVRRFYKIVGFGTLGKKHRHKPHHLQQWQWRANSRKEFEQTVELFRPWLGKRRLAKAEEILETIRSTDWMPFACTHCGWKGWVPIQRGCQAKRYCSNRCKLAARRARDPEKLNAYFREYRRQKKLECVTAEPVQAPAL